MAATASFFPSLERYASAESVPKWSERTTGRIFYKMKSDLRLFLDNISGGDISAMIRSLLTPDELEMVTPAIFSATRNVAKHYNSIVSAERHSWLAAYKNPGGKQLLSRKDMQNLGFLVSEEMWNSCTKPRGIVKGRIPRERAEMTEKVDLYLEKHTETMRGREVFSAKKQKVDARRVDVPFWELYQTFPLRDQISYKTFLKYRDPCFKQTSKKSDMCDYCDDGKKARKSMAQLRSDFNVPEDDTLADIVSKFDEDHALSMAAASILQAQEHRELAITQKDVYNIHTTDPQPGELTIDLDWKQKGYLPIADVETCGNFYGRSQVAVISIGFYWLSATGPRRRVVDVISSSITEDSHCSIAALREAINLLRDDHADALHLTGFSRLHVWADTGSHFRSAEFAHFILVQLPEVYRNITPHLNFLVEKHGKNLRDQHFRCFRCYIRRSLPEGPIVTASQFRDALQKGHAACQAANRALGILVQQVDFYYLNLPRTETYVLKQIKISDFALHTAMKLAHGRLWCFTDSRYQQRIRTFFTITDNVTVQYSPAVSVAKPCRTRKALVTTLKRRNDGRKRLYGVAVQYDSESDSTSDDSD